MLSLEILGSPEKKQHPLKASLRAALLTTMPVTTPAVALQDEPLFLRSFPCCAKHCRRVGSHITPTLGKANLWAPYLSHKQAAS